MRRTCRMHLGRPGRPQARIARWIAGWDLCRPLCEAADCRAPACNRGPAVPEAAGTAHNHPVGSGRPQPAIGGSRASRDASSQRCADHENCFQECRSFAAARRQEDLYDRCGDARNEKPGQEWSPAALSHRNRPPPRTEFRRATRGNSHRWPRQSRAIRAPPHSAVTPLTIEARLTSMPCASPAISRARGHRMTRSPSATGTPEPQRCYLKRWRRHL